MPIFKYKAFSQKGKQISGIVNAEDLEDAKNKLSKQELVIIALKSFIEGESKIHFSKKELYTFTLELAKLIKAGLPLYESLLALEEKYQNSKLHSIILDMSDKIGNGSCLSKALSFHKKSFDLLYCSMIANAENTGSLVDTLEDIARILQRGMQLKKRFLNAILYPMILGIFCFIVLFGLMFFVVPSLFELFEGRSLHPFTSFILTISKFANSYKLLLGLIFIVIVALGVFCASFTRGRKKFYNLLIKVPFIKNLFIKSSIIYFCRAFSTLLVSGVSYVEALSLSRKVINHFILEKEIKMAEEKVIEGERLSKIFKNSKIIPSLVSRMLSVAEESGDEASMLEHIADIYESDLDKAFAYLTTFLQPILLIILGGVIGFVILSILLPLTDVNSFITN
jgi:general secretion pathway protein F